MVEYNDIVRRIYKLTSEGWEVRPFRDVDGVGVMAVYLDHACGTTAATSIVTKAYSGDATPETLADECLRRFEDSEGFRLLARLFEADGTLVIEFVYRTLKALSPDSSELVTIHERRTYCASQSCVFKVAVSADNASFSKALGMTEDLVTL